MFPDSEIANKFACGRTKTTAIVKTALAPYFQQKVLHNMCNPFSIMMDESNDKTNKSCIILVKVLDTNLGDVRTRFLDMPVVNIGTAENLFIALKTSLSKNGLDFSKAMAFMSDTTNVMKGARSGVQNLIKNEHASIYDVGCICHLADLTIKAGMKTLPVNIDQLFVDVFYYFLHSSKRKQQFADNWCSLFSSEPEAIIKHCPTRWLSLLHCVNRYLSQLEGLISYFLSCDDQTSKVLGITERLQNPLTKPLLLFLSHILPSMDRFNRLFQKSTENTTCELYDEMNRLVRLYAANLLKRDAILAASDNLSVLSLEAENQLLDEDLGIGTNTWTHIAELEGEYDTKPFFAAVRNFYLATIKKMLLKFPFSDSLLKDLGVLQPEKTSSYSVNTALNLAKRFPQLGIADPESLDCLREEFLDFSISPADLPTPGMYHASDGTTKPRVGSFWWEVGKLQTADGKQRFAKLYQLMVGLLCIPCSNADSERGFSVLRKIHTDQRSNLDQSTINALMSLKFNCDSCCFDTTFDEKVLGQCKKATHISLSK